VGDGIAIALPFLAPQDLPCRLAGVEVVSE
jgi:hypothetical protein